MISDGWDDLSDTDHEQRYPTAGNDADIEDNDIHTYTITPASLIAKLRKKPPHESAPSTSCRITSNRRSSAGSASRDLPPIPERLSIRPQSALERMSGSVIKPQGGVPSLALPHWHTLPLDQKIPLLPAPPGFMYYSPGKISEKPKGDTKFFSFATRCPYSALVDPHAKNFVQRPITKRLLRQQGLINAQDEIVYPLGQFNKYREYLRTLYADEIHRSFQHADDLFRTEKDQLKVLGTHKGDGDCGKVAERKNKVLETRRMAKQTQDFHKSQTLMKRRQSDARIKAWCKEKERMYLERVLENASRGKAQAEKRKELAREQLLASYRTLQKSAVKSLRSQQWKGQDSRSLKRTNDNYLLEWMDAKIEQSKARMEREREISTAWKESLKARAEKRQKRMEQLRRDLPNKIEQNKRKEAHRWGLVRKYFNIWRENVRQRRKEKQDASHESSWIRVAVGTLEKTVKFLRVQTNTHQKLDNFILNILRLKSAIRKQLELEGDGEELLDELAEASNEADDQIFHYIDAKSGSRHSGLSPHRLNTASP